MLALCVWGLLVPNTLTCPSQEAIYSSIPGAEVPKAEQEAKKKKRAEDSTYITMVRSCSRCGVAPTSLPPVPGPAPRVPALSKHTLVPWGGSHPVPCSLQHPSHCRDNGVYVELAKRTIPTEWMAEGTRGDGQSQEPHSRPEEALPRPPEWQK